VAGCRAFHWWGVMGGMCFYFAYILGLPRVPQQLRSRSTRMLQKDGSWAFLRSSLVPIGLGLMRASSVVECEDCVTLLALNNAMSATSHTAGILAMLHSR
jgi:hypothetical protein